MRTMPHFHKRFGAAFLAIALLAPAVPSPAAAGNLRTNVFLEGPRCRFTDAEAILTAVGWLFGAIPGAILTPLACKRDLFGSASR